MTIISHKYKFIFIKTDKTAGTSVELALEKICGPDDICAPVTQKKQPRPGEESYKARNFEGRFIPRPFRPEGLKSRFRSEIKEFLRRRKYKSHMPATDVRWRLGKTTWNEYFKFTVERNPWDKAVSAYFFARRHKEDQIPFDEWIQRSFNGSSIHFYSLNGKVAMDRVLRFENLQEDLNETLHGLGVKAPPQLPHAKVGFRPKRTDYREVHTDFTRDYVAKVCAPEIAYFGYTFD